MTTGYSGETSYGCDLRFPFSGITMVWLWLFCVVFFLRITPTALNSQVTGKMKNCCVDIALLKTFPASGKLQAEFLRKPPIHPDPKPVKIRQKVQGVQAVPAYWPEASQQWWNKQKWRWDYSDIPQKWHLRTTEDKIYPKIKLSVPSPTKLDVSPINSIHLILTSSTQSSLACTARYHVLLILFFLLGLACPKSSTALAK